MNLLEHLHYDPQTGAFTWLASRGTRRAGAGAGVVDVRDGYVRIQINGRAYLAHRLAWLAAHGTLPSGILDHKNGNRSDNRIKNLRPATRNQNTQNAKTYSSSTAKLKGVSPSGNKWRARIRVDCELVYLGSFPTKEEAHTAYCAAAQKYFGEFFRSGEAPQ